MPQRYLPEGHLLNTPGNLTACTDLPSLHQAARQGTILEGVALLATPEHDLLVRCGPFLGRIPRKEGALGIAEETVRDIAILSRVGKPVCFTVIGWEEVNGLLQPVLSRRQVQERTRVWLEQLEPGRILPATVTHLESYGAFVDVGCGLPSMLSVRHICVSRIPHPSERLTCGQPLWVVVLGHDRQAGHLLISHRELLGTWSDNAALFSPGMTVPGVVRGVHDFGTFVELTANLSGLAECGDPLSPGERVSVYIKTIQSQSMKIKLSLVDRLPPGPPVPMRYFLPDSGRLEGWQYAPEGCRKTGARTDFSIPAAESLCEA